jgi:hypothetical protein
MQLQAGATLGPYEIIAPIGAGGMGEVYRARDTRLGRIVAVKVLPSDVARDPERLQRFEQEARAVAGLNHPNILALHDVGRARPGPTPDPAVEPIVYFVTELLEGRSLRQVLADERLTTGRAIDIATAMAEGLAAAHARGVIHRDVKPDNVFVTTDGHVKLLDFGLAKSMEAPEDPRTAPTRFATEANMVMGTPGYMAPEQARGQAVDSRSDVFALGAVLYEMLSGRRAFSGTTALDLVSSALRDVPPPIPSTIDRPLPPALLGIVERCLEKTPTARFQSTTDLAFALKSLSRSDTTRMTPAPAAAPATIEVAPATRAGQTRTLVFVAAGAVLVIVVALAIWRPWQTANAPANATTATASSAPKPTDTAPVAPPASSTATPVAPPAPSTTTAPAAGSAVVTPAPVTPPPLAASSPSASAPAPATSTPTAAASQPVQRLAVSLADTPINFGGRGASPLAVSPDGTRIAYVANEKGQPGQPPPPAALYVRPVNQFQATRLAGTQGASGPFFSFDGNWIGYLAGGKLMKVEAKGGTPAPILAGDARSVNGGGGSWGADGRIVFDFPLFRAPAAGGEVVDLHQDGRSPQVLPGGAVLFTQVGPAPENIRHAVALLPDGSVKTLVRNAMNPRYVAPGYLVYADRSTLLATKFDVRRLEVSGAPVTMAEDVLGAPQGWSSFSVSANGSLAYLPGSLLASAGRSLFWIDRADGHETPWPFPQRQYGQVLLSPDNSRFLTTFVDNPGGSSAGRAGPAPAPGAPTDARVLFLGDFAKQTLTRLTDTTPAAFTWMPGGGRVVYAKSDGSLYWRNADLSGSEEMLRPPGSLAVVSLGPDQMTVAPGGKSIVWAGRDPATPNGPVGLWLLTDLAGGRAGASMKIERLPGDLPPGAAGYPRVSNDGKWLAFIMRRGTQADLWVRPFPGPGPNAQVATDVLLTAAEWRGPVFSWRKSAGAAVQVMAVNVDLAAPEFHAGSPRVLYAYGAAAGDSMSVEQLSLDSTRFAASRSLAPPPPTQINLIINWVEELRQRLK